MILVISAPSGAGKSTLSRKLRKTFPWLSYSVSMTTRAPRPYEKNGRDYYFISKEKFLKLVKEKKFLEWAEVHNNYYGTPRDFFQKQFKKQKNILLNLDVNGAARVKKIYPRAILVFIAPPSLKVLEQRLRKRGKDSETTIVQRLKNARKELKRINKYDYLIVNDRLDTAFKQLKNIVLNHQEN